MHKKQVLGIIRGEFINKTIEITDAKNKTLIGLSGKIIDETKNTFTIITGKGNKKKLLKNHIIFTITENIGGKKATLKINGAILAKRPEQRLLIKKL